MSEIIIVDEILFVQANNLMSILLKKKFISLFFKKKTKRIKENKMHWLKLFFLLNQVYGLGFPSLF
jgi:hypothetical protein